jgi:PAS domain S-box-containing protein
MLGLATYVCLTLWDRRIRQEERAVLRQVRAQEAEARRLVEAERRTAEELAASERRHRALTGAGSVALWRAAPDGRLLGLEGWTMLTGQSAAEACANDRAWLEPLDPLDRPRAAEAWARAVREGREMEEEVRLRAPGGRMRWCRTRAVPIRDEAGGEVLEWVGVVEDIDARRRSEEDRALLSREVNHRAKNLLAVIQTVVRLTRANNPQAFVTSVNRRIAALARAHDLLAARDWRDTELRSVVESELAGHMAPDRMQVLAEGPPVKIAAIAVQPLSMVLHELATNAARYGAFSCPEGRVSVRWWLENEALRLRWQERGGPPVTSAPERNGFGTRIIDASMAGQLGGGVSRRWEEAGLRCDLTLPVGRVLPRWQDLAA